jgi:phospho-N-acetylmuramoyl-pentapeptide-transferase
MTLDIIKVIAPAALAFAFGILITPVVTHYLYKYRCWKKKSVVAATDGASASISAKLHNDEERKTPRMGGMVVWGSSVITILVFLILSYIDGAMGEKLNFLSRNQTWLPLFTLVVGALIGFLDDYMTISDRYDHVAGGLSGAKRIILVTLVGAVGAWWFYTKLDVSTIIVPFYGLLDIGILFVPLFIVVMLASYSGGFIDGLDGLSGGVFAAIFSAYGVIAFAQNQIDLAAFCFMLVGALMAFLWFNIPPARFFMSETGIMALTMTLAVVAFLTQQVLVLPIIAFLLVATSASSIIQLLSKKFRDGKKVFLVAPLHHHFQALGWPATKVVMRYWVLAMMFATVGGVIIALIG